MFEGGINNKSDAVCVLARLAAHFLYKYLRGEKITTGKYSGHAKIRTVAIHLQMPASRMFSQPLLPAFVCQGEAQPKSMPQNLLLLFACLVQRKWRESGRKQSSMRAFVCVCVCGNRVCFIFFVNSCDWHTAQWKQSVISQRAHSAYEYYLYKL